MNLKKRMSMSNEGKSNDLGNLAAAVDLDSEIRCGLQLRCI